MGIKIGVTEPEYRKAESVFSGASEAGCDCVPVPSDEKELAEELRRGRFQHVIVGVTAYRGPLYEALDPGAVIARFGVGHDGLDKALATSRGLLCTNTPGVLDDSVAEHAMGLIMSLARHTPLHVARVERGQWLPQLGMELKGKRLGVIGCGGIGRRLSRIASRGFGMTVVGLRRSHTGDEELRQQFGFDRVVSNFEEAAAGTDFLSLHLPGGPETRHFLNRARLESLPRGCFLINTARGSLIDEDSLFDALSQGRIAGAALDVFETEPYRPQTPEKDLRHLSNLVMTPHIGSSTREACDRMAQGALRNIRLAGERKHAEMNLLNPAVLPRIQAITTH